MRAAYRIVSVRSVLPDMVFLPGAEMERLAIR
jgi:hypothetical protein